MEQQLFRTLEQAHKAAKDLSINGENKAAWIIQSKADYFVEDESPLIRNFETLIAEYQNGKLINQK